MKSYTRSHLADETLMRNVVANTGAVCDATADQLADIGEIDARRLYLPAGYPSTHASACTSSAPRSAELSPGKVDGSSIPVPSDAPTMPLAAPHESPAPRPRLIPLAPGRFGLQVTIDQETHDLLRYAQALLSHVMPPSNLEAVLKRVVSEGVARLERQRFAATEQPGSSGRREATERRYVPAEVKRLVWKRDGGRCTFVSETGVRCPEEAWLQFDHIEPYARGGEATAANIRLRCHAHNQYEAECAFGTEFMRQKREGARRRAEPRKSRPPVSPGVILNSNAAPILTPPAPAP